MKKSPLVPLLAVVTLAVGGVIATLATSTRPLLGLDLQGGASVVLQPSRKVDPAVLDRTIGIIRQRVDGSGVGESEITRQGSSIIVSLPGVKDPDRILSIVGRTAELRFRPVLQDLPSEDAILAQQIAAKSATTTTLKPGAPTTTAKAGATTATTKPVATTAKPTVTTAKAVEATTSAAALGEGPGIGRFIAAAAAVTTTSSSPTSSLPAVVTTVKSPTTVAGNAPTSIVPLAVPVATTPPPPATPNAKGFDTLLTTAIEDDVKAANVILQLQKRDPASDRLILGQPK